MRYRVILSSPDVGNVFLGNYSESEVSHLCETFSREGVSLSIRNYSEKRKRIVANPSLDDTEKGVAERSIKSPIEGFKRQLLASKTTIGPKREVQYPIQKNDFMKYSLDEAALNLAVLIPTARKRLPVAFIEEMEKKRHISQAFINKWKRKGSGNAIQEVVLEVVNQLLKTNTKMEKSKVPSVLGLGKPSEIEGFNDTFVEGAKGLSFLPNITLIEEQRFSSGEVSKPSFLKVLEDTHLEEDLLGTKSSNTLFRDICVETLTPLRKKKLSACVRATEECIVPCLVDSGQRYVGGSRGGVPTDIYGAQTTQAKEYASRYGRMVLGCRQTAFLANPYYFFRVLVQSILNRVISYEANLCLINEQVVDPTEQIDTQMYRKYIPPSVRLNTYSDYMWESICPALFEIFSGNTTGYPYVQFYDYTKIPGRWSTEQRDLVKEHFQISYKDSYKVPDNYHLTFSFAGTPSSAKESNLASHVGQNSTVVYYTTNIKATTLGNTITASATKNEQDWGEELNEQIIALRKSLKKALTSEGFTVQKLHTARGSLLPLKKRMSNKDFKVINGDAYDLRFLDEYLKDSLDQSLIVGLSWKAPTSISVGLQDGPTVSLNPFSATAFNAYTKTAKFAEMRLNLGIDLEFSNIDTTVELFISPIENNAESIRELFKGIAKIPQSELDNFTFSTESGKPLNNSTDADFVKDFIEKAIKDFIYSFA